MENESMKKYFESIKRNTTWDISKFEEIDYKYDRVLIEPLKYFFDRRGIMKPSITLFQIKSPFFNKKTYDFVSKIINNLCENDVERLDYFDMTDNSIIELETNSCKYNHGIVMNIDSYEMDKSTTISEYSDKLILFDRFMKVVYDNMTLGFCICGTKVPTPIKYCSDTIITVDEIIGKKYFTNGNMYMLSLIKSRTEDPYESVILQYNDEQNKFVCV